MAFDPEKMLREGRVYECVPEDLAYVPVDIQIRMMQGGRLRPARYDGNGAWHVLEDFEIKNHFDAKTNPSEADPNPTLPRLDLGSGLNPKEGFESVDLYAPEAKHKVDLFKFPWPWEDNSIGAIHSSHFFEHVPAREVEERDLKSPSDKKHLGKDFLFAVVDECWRILAPKGDMLIIVPSARSDGAFQDPTHRRFFNENTFGYFSKQSRIQMNVPHYRISANFRIVQIIPVGPVEIGFMHPEVQAAKFRKEWNATYEFHALFRKEP